MEKELRKKISRVESAENLEELKEAIVDLVEDIEIPNNVDKRLGEIESRLDNATVDIDM